MTFLSTVIFRGHTLSLCTMKPAQGQTSESFTSFTRGLVSKAKSVSSKLRRKFQEVAFTKHKSTFDSLFCVEIICYQVSLSALRLTRIIFLQAGVLCIDPCTTMFLVPSCKLAVYLGECILCEGSLIFSLRKHIRNSKRKKTMQEWRPVSATWESKNILPKTRWTHNKTIAATSDRNHDHLSVRISSPCGVNSRELTFVEHLIKNWNYFTMVYPSKSESLLMSLSACNECIFMSCCY